MDMKVMKMIDKEVDLGSSFFESEEDEGPVDMAMVFEAMKHVPLPDIQYLEQDDPIADDNPVAVTIPRGPLCSQPDYNVSKGALKRRAFGTEEIRRAKGQGVGTGRISKLLKVETEIDDLFNKPLPTSTAKAEALVSIAKLPTAEVAAEGTHDFVDGLVADAGPCPDFSLWTVDDDLLLKSAMEAGAAMEALAKGALRFSRRFTVREIRERWRALLYDPEIAGQAAARMVEAEYGDTHPRPSSTELKTPQEIAKKRRENSVRTLFYKKRKKAAVDNVRSGNAESVVGSGVKSLFVPKNGLSVDFLAEPVLDSVAIRSADMNSASAKEPTSSEFEDRTFSQMFSLLAEGGIRAVVSAIPTGSSVLVSKQDTSISRVDGQSMGGEVSPLGMAPGLMASTEDAAVVQAGNGLVPFSESPLIVQEQGAQGDSMGASSTDVGFDCQKVEEDSRRASHSNASPSCQEMSAQDHLVDACVAEPRHDCPTVEEGPGRARHLNAMISQEQSARGHSMDTGLTEARHDCQKAEEGLGRAPHLSAIPVVQERCEQGLSLDTGLAEGRLACQMVEEGSERAPILNAIPIGQEQTAQGDLVDTTPTKATGDCHMAEENTSLQDLETGSRLLRVAADSSVGLQAEGDRKVFDCTGAPAVSLVPKQQEFPGTFCRHNVGTYPGAFPELLHDSDRKGNVGMSFRFVDESHVQGGKVQSKIAAKTQCNVTVSEVKDEQHCAADSVLRVDHMEVSDTEATLCSSPKERPDSSKLDHNETTQVEEKSPLLMVDTAGNIDDEVADKVGPAMVQCWCGAYCTTDVDGEEEGDLCDGIATDDQCHDGEVRDGYVPGVLAGESSSYDQICLDGSMFGSGDLQPLKTGIGVVEPSLCVLNTEDTEIPSLEGALLSPRTSSSSSYYEYDGYTGSPYDNVHADEDLDAAATASAGNVKVLNSSCSQDGANTKIGPGVVDGVGRRVHDITEFGLPVDRSGGMAAIKSSKRHNQTVGSGCGLDDEHTGFNFTCQQICTGFTSSVIPSDQNAPLVSPIAGYSHHQFELQAGGDGSSQAVNVFRASDRQALPMPVVPGIGDVISNLSLCGGMPNGKPPGEPIWANGSAQMFVEESLEYKIESDEEIAHFSEIEATVLNMGLHVVDDDFSARAESRRMLKRYRKLLVRAEQASDSAMRRTLHDHAALAVLYGMRLKYYITQAKVLVGRATSDNIVDVDLGREGRANKVSRQQANIKLKGDGVFYLRNLGRRGLTVNNKSVATGQRAILCSNCLIEVGGMCFIFYFNTKLVREHILGRYQPTQEFS